jgi:hypothetical protein
VDFFHLDIAAKQILDAQRSAALVVPRGQAPGDLGVVLIVPRALGPARRRVVAGVRAARQ